MKHTLLVALASAAIGAATATVLRDNPSPPPRAAPQARVHEGALELAFVRALERMGFGEQARASGATVVAEPGPDAPGANRATRTPAVPILPPANQVALEDVRSFEDEPTRREWIFRSEKDVVDWLGTPDLAYVSDGGEQWHYKLADGKDVILQFHRGRLLRIFR